LVPVIELSVNCNSAPHFLLSLIKLVGLCIYDPSFYVFFNFFLALLTDTSLIESLTKDLELLKKEKGYSVVPPPPTQVYSPPKKDMSWTGLLEFKDDTVTDYSRPSPAIESTSDNAQNKNPSVIETGASPSTISPKPFIKFVKANNSLTKSKTDKVETAKKPHVKYAEQYRKPTKKPNVRGNQRNWNNLKSHQLGPNFVMKKGML
nr:hypothetical protein [Tanacetum cinerariifolium]